MGDTDQGLAGYYLRCSLSKKRREQFPRIPCLSTRRWLPMRTRIGLVVIVGLLIAADAAQDDAVKQEIKQLEGSWKGTLVEHKGKRLGFGRTLVIKGDKYTLKGLKVNDPERNEEGTFKLDPSQKPKTVDL